RPADRGDRRHARRAHAGAAARSAAGEGALRLRRSRAGIAVGGAEADAAAGAGERGRTQGEAAHDPRPADGTAAVDRTGALTSRSVELSRPRTTARAAHPRRRGASVFQNAMTPAWAPSRADAAVSVPRESFRRASLRPSMLRVPLRSGSAACACFTPRSPLCDRREHFNRIHVTCTIAGRRLWAPWHAAVHEPAPALWMS